jgi:transcriptional regulator of arginine metabolism
MTDRKNDVKKDTFRQLIDTIKSLLLEGVVGTQAEIQQALQQQGFDINQSKVSRILRKLGAVKMTNERGESTYGLQHGLMPPSTDSSLARLIIDVVANETLIVIHTNPGSASLVARLLDHQAQDLGILGTVAGDDTLFVVPKLNRDIENTLAVVKRCLYE